VCLIGYNLDIVLITIFSKPVNWTNFYNLEDPPVESKTAGIDFGSWYSSGGNIIGECGVPYG
jgi:hypothetical protein